VLPVIPIVIDIDGVSGAMLRQGSEEVAGCLDVDLGHLDDGVALGKALPLRLQRPVVRVGSVL